MEKSNVVKIDEKIQNAILSKWSKLTRNEAKQLVEDHDKLPDVLVKKYFMSKSESKKNTEDFFKQYEHKKVAGLKH